MLFETPKRSLLIRRLTAASCESNQVVDSYALRTMDPVSAVIGIAAGIASLLKVSRTIYSWIKGFRGADGNLRDLQVLFIDFNRLLVSLQRDLNDEDISRRIPPEETNIIIGLAKETLQELKNAIQAVRKVDVIDASRIQWILNERKCQGLQHRLSQHRESLHGLLASVHSVQMYVNFSFHSEQFVNYFCQSGSASLPR